MSDEQEKRHAEIKRICEEEFGAGNTPDWLIRDILNYMNREIKAYTSESAEEKSND